MSLSPAERFARYMHQPPAWANREYLADWHTSRDDWYQRTTNWTDRNRDGWGSWFNSATPRQRRRIEKKLRRSTA
jgi:hypothetical protein